MPTIIENINNIISTKSELKTILTENGLEPSENFNEYPDMFRSIVGGGGSIDEAALNGYISTYLTTYNFVDQPSLSSNSYITDVVFNNGTGGFITSIQNSDSGGQHIILYNRGEAITPSVLASCGYITSADLPTIDENIIPKADTTYTLGNSTYMYDTTYTSKINGPSGGLVVRLGTTGKAAFYDGSFRPTTNGQYNLGTSQYAWASTYTSNIYSGNVYLTDNNVLYNKSQYQVTLRLNGSDRYVFRTNHLSPANNGGSDLGQSDLYWNNAYITNAYISNYNNLIWTGTSAQYAALADYTTYQIYMIKES